MTDLWRCRTKPFRDAALSPFALVFHPILAQSMLTGGTTMRRTLFVVLLAVLSLGFARAQRQPYRVAFDLTSRDTLEQKAVLRWLKEVSTSSPDAQMEVVMYAKGFDLVMPERSAYIADVKEAMKNPNVAFKVCAIALKNNNVDKSRLLPGVETVPDGIHELVMKQQDHWGYIKVVH
jgi:intracellular sulfur oxidation DsrE/DsrF family protein